MRTTVENKKDMQYDLRLEGVNVRSIIEPETTLIRSSFYDFAASHGAVFFGYSDEKESEFAASLF